MGWLWVWLQGREERRAEAAVRRQMAALEHDRQRAALSQPPQMASLVDYGHEQRLDAIRREIVTLEHVMDLIEECDRADQIADRRDEHGGFVTTARIRELLRGGS